MSTIEIDVLVVGAGPTGLALAHELRRHGLRCRVIDQGEGPSISMWATRRPAAP